jgi:hypothetical protein
LRTNNEELQQNIIKNSKYERKRNENEMERNWNEHGTKMERRRNIIKPRNLQSPKKFCKA